MNMQKKNLKNYLFAGCVALAAGACMQGAEGDVKEASAVVVAAQMQANIQLFGQGHYLFNLYGEHIAYLTSCEEQYGKQLSSKQIGRMTQKTREHASALKASLSAMRIRSCEDLSDEEEKKIEAGFKSKLDALARKRDQLASSSYLLPDSPAERIFGVKSKEPGKKISPSKSGN